MGTIRHRWGLLTLVLLCGCGESVAGPAEPTPGPEGSVAPTANLCTRFRQQLMVDFPAAVSDQLLATVVNEPTFVESRTDRGADGTTDGCYVYLYTAEGFKTLSADDDDGDLIPDGMHHIYEHDEAGNPVLYRSDSDGDLVFESYGGSVYDELGNAISSWRDDDHDGVIDLLSYATFDAEGRRLSQWHDEDGDGQVDDLTTFTYDEDGRRLGIYGDFDADGAIDRQSLNVYGEQGLLIEQIIEEAQNGVLLVVEHHRVTYDEQGRETGWEVDYDDDGQADARSSVTHDGTSETTAFDFEADGIVDNYEYAEYGFYGQRKEPLRIEDDYGADGVIDRLRRWQRDDGGRTRVFEMDGNGDGVITLRQTYLRVP